MPTVRQKLNLIAPVCMAMGLESEAKDHLREAIRINPYFTGSAAALFEVAVRTGDLRAAREAADALISVQGPSEQWASMRCGTAEAEPAHHLGVIARGGDLNAAKRHAALAVQLEPGNPVFIAGLEEIELLLDDLEPMPAFLGDPLEGPHTGALGAASLARSVVVVSYNSESLISECVTCVLSTLGEADELIVVDNASTDGTAAIIRELAASESRIVFLPQVENLGYSKACNLGMLASRGEFIVALNPDAFVEARVAGWAYRRPNRRCGGNRAGLLQHRGGAIC